MKKVLLVTLGAAVLMLSLSPAASASAFLQLSNGASTLTCDNSAAFTATNCGAGFVTVANGNNITFGGAVGGYNVTQVSLTGNQPGTAVLATANDSKNAVQNLTAGATSLIITFAENNFSLPAGTPLTVSSSQSGTFAVAQTGNGQTFSAWGSGGNTLTVGAGTLTGPTTCLSPAPAPTPTGGTTSCSANSIPTSFARAGNFAVSGSETIALVQGGIANFTATIDVTPPPPIPEPSSLLLLGSGLVLLASRKLRKK